MRRLKIFKIYFVFLLFLFFLVYANFKMIVVFFMATLTFNIAVLTALTIGLIIIMTAAYKLIMLAGTFGTIRYKKGKQLEFYLNGIQKVMPPNIARMFQSRAKKGALYFTFKESQDVSEWLEEKFSNQKVYINFFISTSLMIGLFGTFTGLLKSIDDMGGIILSLTGDINLAEVIAGFAGPLGGMAIGFGSSLFGVASAIILSVMGYILQRNQEILIEDIDDWMSGQIVDTPPDAAGNTVVATSDGGGAGGGVGGGFINTFIESISDFSNKVEHLSRSNEAMTDLLKENLESSSSTVQNEVLILESISNSIKEQNINQYSSTNMLEESLQEISTATMNENKTLKQIVELQRQNNENMTSFIQGMDQRLQKLEEMMSKMSETKK